ESHLAPERGRPTPPARAQRSPARASGRSSKQGIEKAVAEDDAQGEQVDGGKLVGRAGRLQEGLPELRDQEPSMRATFFGVARLTAHEANVVLAEDRARGHHFDDDERQEYARLPSEAILDPVGRLAEHLLHLETGLLLHLAAEGLVD